MHGSDAFSHVHFVHLNMSCTSLSIPINVNLFDIKFFILDDENEPEDDETITNIATNGKHLLLQNGLT